MKQLINIIWIANLATCLYSCRQQERSKVSHDEIESVVNDWLGRTINIPDDAWYEMQSEESIASPLSQYRYTILRYVNSEGCSSCKLHLQLYPKILQELSDSLGYEIGFLCIINPSDPEEIRHILGRDIQAGLMVWIDENDTINKINHFPNIESLQTFLIDSENKVLAIGDPAINPKILRLYTQILTNGANNTAQLPLTTLNSDKDEIIMGNVCAGDSVHYDVGITNTGRSTFHLDKVLTSCGCTTASLSKSIIRPQESATLHISFSESDAVGDVYRIISIFGNTEDELIIELFGNVTPQ